MKREKVKNKKGARKMAIFDIDGTVFRSSLLIELTEALIRKGIFPSKVREVYKKSYRKWLERTGSYEEYIMDVVKAFDQNIKGVQYTDFVQVAKSVIDSNHNMVYAFTRDLIKSLRRDGYYMLAISHSPKEIVEEFAQTFGFDKTYGRVYARGTDGALTGRGLYEDKIFDKADILKLAISKEGLTLDGSVGVGDTEGDMTFLRMVTTPICFNPNKKLYTIAKREGWRVVVERKDMVYEM